MWPFKKKIFVPTTEKIYQIKSALQYSPDAPFRETHNPWVIFVCDDLQYGLRNHHVLLSAGAKRVDPHQNHIYAYTSTQYVLWKYKNGRNSFAVPLDNPPARFVNAQRWDTVSPTANIIKGEVYKISPYGLFKLDDYYRNTVEYERRDILIVVPFHYEIIYPDGSRAISLRSERLVHAVMYVGKQAFWDNILDGQFVPAHKIVPKNEDYPTYYSYTHHEYK